MAECEAQVAVQHVLEPSVAGTLYQMLGLEKDFNGPLVLAHHLQSEALLNQGKFRAAPQSFSLVKSGQGLGKPALVPAKRSLKIEKPSEI